MPGHIDEVGDGMIEKLGPYRIDKLLGRGGMGTVYAGTHEETGQCAAIKALSMLLADDGNFRERFVTEIETLKHLTHPNIVQLYGDGEHDGHLFYVMELVDGKNLQEELQQGYRFEWQEVTKIGVQVCQALQHAHAHGIIHRDLKPANLLRDPDGNIKLADFGIAKLFGATNLTADGSVVGTADYMAPEQSDDRPISYRTDLYSLGNVLFTLLARRPPFTAKSIPEMLHKLRYDEAPSVRKFTPQVPLELEQILGQLLQKDPENRIPTALALANQLRAMEHGLSGDTVVDSSSEEDEPSPNDQVTQISKIEGPGTEVGPTAVDSGSNSKPRDDYAWNDATVVTSESEAKDGSSAKSSDTIIDEPAARNRFTTVEDARRASSNRPQTSWGDYLKIAALALAIVVLVGGVVWALRPPSADTLVQRIENAIAAEDTRKALASIEDFETQHANHPKREEVRGWKLDIQCQYLFARLRKDAQKQKLTDVRNACFEAFKEQEEEVARGKFDQVIKEYADTEDDSTPITCVEAARHRKRRLEESLGVEATADSESSRGIEVPPSTTAEAASTFE
jgi:serine/threonine-protein kinase